MTNDRLPGDERPDEERWEPAERDDREDPRADRDRDDDQPDVSLPGSDFDGSGAFVDDATGESYDDLADRAQAVIDRAHALDKPELEPDDASAAAQAASARPGPDADERPA